MRNILVHDVFIKHEVILVSLHKLVIIFMYAKMGARGSVVGRGTMLQAGTSPVRVPDEMDIFNLPNSSNRTMALRSTQPLTEMNTRNLFGGKKRPTRRADNLAAICEPNA
jgi:hypothetical protein